MRSTTRLWTLLALLAAAPASVAAQDTDALARDAVGLPLRPRDAAAGPWTLTSGGRTICALRLGAERSPAGAYAADIPADCATALPAGVVGWKPVTDGMALVGADGRSMIDFNQWTPRDLVARRRGAPPLALTRSKSAP
jgi:hypothetical protein